MHGVIIGCSVLDWHSAYDATLKSYSHEQLAIRQSLSLYYWCCLNPAISPEAHKNVIHTVPIVCWHNMCFYFLYSRILFVNPSKLVCNVELLINVMYSIKYKIAALPMLPFHQHLSVFIMSFGDLLQLTSSLGGTLESTTAVLVSKILSQINLDIHLALTSLLDLSFNSSLPLVRKSAASYGSQYLRTVSLSNVTLVICDVSNQDAYKCTCQSLKKDAIWGYLLSLYGVS